MVCLHGKVRGSILKKVPDHEGKKIRIAPGQSQKWGVKGDLKKLSMAKGTGPAR